MGVGWRVGGLLFNTLAGEKGGGGVTSRTFSRCDVTPFHVPPSPGHAPPTTVDCTLQKQGEVYRRTADYRNKVRFIDGLQTTETR